MIAASIYQMIRGMIVFVVAFYSIIFLWRKYFWAHWLGLFLLLIGVSMVGYGGVLESENKDDGKETSAIWTLVGIGILIVATLFAGGVMITEEVILTSYWVDPLKMVGI